MRRMSLLVALPFLGGCLAAVSTHEPTELHSGQPTHAVTQETKEARPQRSHWPDSLFLLNDEPLLLSEDGFIQELQEPTDAETMEDNLLLSGIGEDPPEDEGETVTPEVSFDFPVVENEKVRYYIDYFSGNGQRVFARWLERSGRYLPMMQEVFAEEGLPLDLVYLAMIESGFNNQAYSWAHAVGPWQFIASTGKMYGLTSDWWRDDRRDPVKATRAAARHLNDLYQTFDDWYLAAAAYNAGAGKMRRAIQMYNTRDFWEISHGSYLARETKHYVPKLLAAMLIAKQPDKYGFTDLNYHQPLAYDTVVVPTATDLDLIADLTGATYDEIKQLNPELRRWCTPPEIKDYEVRIPAGTRDAFLEKYAEVPVTQRAKFQRHRIKQGDTLLALAKRYNIRVDDIVRLNKISNPRALRVGSDLILPLAGGVTARNPLADLREPTPTRRSTYTVRRGDSLWSISRRYNITEHQLRVWNKLGWSNNIRPGQVLIVSAPRAASASQTARGSGTGRQISHKVVSGDSLWTIARRYNVTEKELREWNRLGQSDLIRPGQVLQITPRNTVAQSDSGLRKVVYQVQPGDTLWGIGRRFEVATRQIMDWNNLSDKHILRPGDTLTLMVKEGSG